jgi:two-component system alkaline phosphatase synthesis response regulator PhoP
MVEPCSGCCYPSRSPQLWKDEPMRRRVLIVDDDPDILLLLRYDLEAEGFETVLASDGSTALRRIEDERPDVVILDLMMPVLDGWAALERIQDLSRPPQVVVLSAKTAETDRERARNLGAVAYVAKPFDVQHLVETIKAAMRGSPAAR